MNFFVGGQDVHPFYSNRHIGKDRNKLVTNPTLKGWGLYENQAIGGKQAQVGLDKG
jgi:hypothetical protein